MEAAKTYKMATPTTHPNQSAEPQSDSGQAIDRDPRPAL